MNDTTDTKTEKKPIPLYYTNFVSFAVSPSDFTLDFGYKLPEVVKEKKEKKEEYEPGVRVVMSPAHAKIMFVVLGELLKNLEKDVGEIALEPAYRERYKKVVGKKK